MEELTVSYACQITRFAYKFIIESTVEYNSQRLSNTNWSS